MMIEQTIPWRRSLSHFTARLLRRVRIVRTPVASALDISERLPRNSAVVVRKGHADQWLVFDCPCRAGHRVMLNLDKRDWPVWTILAAVPLTLAPSVDE